MVTYHKSCLVAVFVSTAIRGAAAFMDFSDSIYTAEQLVNSFLTEGGGVRVSNIRHSPHFELCAAFYSNGHSLGRIKDYETGEDTADFIVPNEGIILSSGRPEHFNNQTSDAKTTAWYYNMSYGYPDEEIYPCPQYEVAAVYDEISGEMIDGGNVLVEGPCGPIVEGPIDGIYVEGPIDGGTITEYPEDEFYLMNDFSGQLSDEDLRIQICLSMNETADLADCDVDVYDACWVEFDFTCEAEEEFVPEVNFQYVFGSEEYFEYVASEFNDAFAFILNGENIALLPTTDTNSRIVSINNVNYDNNTDYFHGNDPPSEIIETDDDFGNSTNFTYPCAIEPVNETEYSPCENLTEFDHIEFSKINVARRLAAENTVFDSGPSDGVDYDTRIWYPNVEADGFTSILTAFGTPKPGLNTIKLVVGDVGDGILDSWVLLGADSFSCKRKTHVGPNLVFEDLNGDGVIGENETGLANITVLLHTTEENETLITTTDDEGFYKFEDIPPGDYYVEVLLEPEYVFSPMVDDGNQASESETCSCEVCVCGATPNTTLNGETEDTWNVGVYLPVTIGNKVWEDSNGNGVQDEGEPGMPGITAVLYDIEGNEVANTTTDEAGFYKFEGLSPGEYAVQFEIPEDYVFTLPESELGEELIPLQGGVAITDVTSDVNTDSGSTDMIAVESGEINNSFDAGIFVPIQVGGSIWHDLNADGIKDEGEPALPSESVAVMLFDGNGAPQALKVVGGSGDYVFSDLRPGTYSVKVIPQSEDNFYLISPTGDSDFDPETKMTAPVTLNSGDSGDGLFDAGLYALASVGGLVWEDFDADGVQDEMEPPYYGGDITIVLVDPQDNSTVLDAASIDANGTFSFYSLTPGDYIVKFFLENGTAFSDISEGKVGNMVDPATNEAFVTVTSGEVAGVIAGVFSFAQIGPNLVFDDLNGDGVVDENETGLVNVTVTLYDEDGNEAAVATTDSEGSYTFEDIPPGSYIVEVELDSEYVFSPIVEEGNQAIESDSCSCEACICASFNVTLESGEIVDSFDAGVYVPVQIGGSIWHDLNADGIKDDGEPASPVPVSALLFDANGKPSGLQNSDEYGNYLFTNLKPGTYYVKVIPQSEENYLISPTGDSDFDPETKQTNPVTVDSENSGDGLFDAGLYQLASIGGQVHEVELPFIGNVTVVLYDPEGSVLDTTSTDENGEYSFVDLTPGDYEVEFVLEDSDVFFDILEGEGDLVTTYKSNVTLTSGEAAVVDVGVLSLSQIGPNRIFEDLNGDGVHNEGEPGLANITVVLHDDGGNEIATITTDDDGLYVFTGIPPGDHYVEVQVDPEYEFSLVVDGGNQVTESDTCGCEVCLCGITPTVGLGEIANPFHAGVYLPVQVGGNTWHDLNADGVKDEGEPPLTEAVAAMLFDADGEPVGLSTTNESGDYAFPSLRPGTYHVQIVPPRSAEYLVSPTGDSDFDPETKLTDPVTLNSGESGDGLFDAGFYRLSSVGGLVWDDQNGDGVQDEGEEPYEAVTVNLRDPKDNNALIATMSTDSNGEYNFTDVIPGDYTIDFVLEDGTVFSESVSLVSGQVDDDVDKGISSRVADVGPNLIFEDLNGDGVIDPEEPGLSGVRVVLRNAYGEEVAETSTDNDGYYTFPGIEPGFYFIEVQNGPDYNYSPIVDGGNQVSFDDESGYGQSPVAELDIGMIEDTWNAGMWRPGSIGNKVWNDLDGDGLQGADEPGVAGVVATLIDGNGNAIDEMATDEDGIYLFEDLAPGDYAVEFDIPGGFLFTPLAKESRTIEDPADGSMEFDDVTSDVDTDTGSTPTVSLTSGAVNLSFDAGIFIPVSINGTTWHDLNADGIRDPDEPGLPGSIVTLYDRDGDPIGGTKETDEEGIFSWEELPPGTYHASVVPPTDEYLLSDTGEESDFNPDDMTSAPIRLESGESGEGSFDAGFYLPATLGDRVWLDEKPNGIQDGDETSAFEIPMTITLKDSLGYVIDTQTPTSTGFYQFTGLKPGEYEIMFVLEDDDYVLTMQNRGDDIELDSDPGSTSGIATVTLTSGEINNSVDAGVMDAAPYYPDWIHENQVCTNDGFDPAWLEIQKVNYLYTNKEECCKRHFWWRIPQCMANMEYKYFKEGNICESKSDFEDWELNGPAHWTTTTLFDTLEECCANKFWDDFEGCMLRSPLTFEFSFCVDIKGLVDPVDCQTADIMANVIGDAINDGVDSDRRRLEHGLYPTAASISRIGDVALSIVDGSTVCGGSLGGQGFTNGMTRSVPDLDSAVDNIVSVCGVMTVVSETCAKEDCLNDMYEEVTDHMTEYVNEGTFTSVLQEKAATRLPAVPELLEVTGEADSYLANSLVLPAIVSGTLNWKWTQGNGLTSCVEKVSFGPTELSFDTLYECCDRHFKNGIEQCCDENGGCEELDNAPPMYTFLQGTTCSSMKVVPVGKIGYDSLQACCDYYFPWSGGPEKCCQDGGGCGGVSRQLMTNLQPKTNLRRAHGNRA